MDEFIFRLILIWGISIPSVVYYQVKQDYDIELIELVLLIALAPVFLIPMILIGGMNTTVKKGKKGKRPPDLGY